MLPNFSLRAIKISLQGIGNSEVAVGALIVLEHCQPRGAALPWAGGFLRGWEHQRADLIATFILRLHQFQRMVGEWQHTAFTVFAGSDQLIALFDNQSFGDIRQRIHTEFAFPPI